MAVSQEEYVKLVEAARRKLDELKGEIPGLTLDEPQARHLFAHLYTQYLTFGGQLRLDALKFFKQKLQQRGIQGPDDISDALLGTYAHWLEKLAEKAQKRAKPGQLPLPVEQIRFLMVHAEYKRATELVTYFGADKFRLCSWGNATDGKGKPAEIVDAESEEDVVAEENGAGVIAGETPTEVAVASTHP